MQAADRGIAAQDLDRALRSFQRLGTETARRVLEFYQLRRQSEAVTAAGPAFQRRDEEANPLAVAP